jgi:hypothetical protein
MNNNYYKLVKLMRDLLEDNPIVNTLIYARTEDKDLYKNNIYPLVHINPTSSPWLNYQVNEFAFEIGVLNQRTSDDRDKETKFEGNDNIIDNHNTCYSILNDFLSSMEMSEESALEVTSISNITPLFLTDTNGLDGWVSTISIKVNNTIDFC